jgi:hypothetical protein
MWRRSSLVAVAVTVLGCGRSGRSRSFDRPEHETAPPAATSPHPSPASPASPASPPWPKLVEAPSPPGFRWETVHHQTVHARLLVPTGVTPVLRTDANGYPAVDLAVEGNPVRCQFDSGIGALGATLTKKPPTVYGITPQASEVDDDHAAARYVDAVGTQRISGFAPGVKCSYEGFGELPVAVRDAIFTVCASVRSPSPGAWHPASEAQLAHGGMTDVPDGAWVEGELPGTPGSLLRSGPFIASMHVGELVIRSGPCPASFEALRQVDAPEVEAELEHRQGATGDAWIRRATETYDGNRYPGATTVLVPRGPRCCVAEFVPWTRPVAADKIAYAIALCDTFRAP